MCGRVVQASDPLRPAILEGLNAPSSREKPPSYNVAPSQLLYLIRENHDTGERVLGLLRRGLIPYDCTDPDGGRKPINARAEFGRAASDLPQCLLEAPLHRAGRLLLRGHAARDRGRRVARFPTCRRCFGDDNSG